MKKNIIIGLILIGACILYYYYTKPSDNSYFDIIFKAMEHAQINAQSLLKKLNETQP